MENPGCLWCAWGFLRGEILLSAGRCASFERGICGDLGIVSILGRCVDLRAFPARGAGYPVGCESIDHLCDNIMQLCDNIKQGPGYRATL